MKIYEQNTANPVPYVNISSKPSGISMVSESDGTFLLKPNELNSVDSLRFTCIGYKAKTVSKSAIFASPTVYLREDEIILQEIGISGKRYTEILSPFKYVDVLYSEEHENNQSFISSRAPLAKPFTSPVDSFKVEYAYIGRFVEKLGKDILLKVPLSKKQDRVLSPNNFIFPMKKYRDSASFVLHILEPDEKGLPSRILKSLTINFTEAKSINLIDLRQYNIRPSTKLFFFAIQWIPSPYNQNYRISTKKSYRPSKQPDEFTEVPVPTYEIGYEPYISTLKKSSGAPFGYVLLNGKWNETKSIANFRNLNDVAISASISYYK